MKKTRSLFAALLCSAAAMLPAATLNVSSIPDLKAAIAKAEPGDRIVVADGQYVSSGSIAIAKMATEAKPIVIAAQTVGGVEIQGSGGFTFKAPSSYVAIEGFNFTHKAGAMMLPVGVTHCRVARNVFNLSVEGRSTFVTVSGDDNEIDHNIFRDKQTEGQMLMVEGPGSDQMAQRTWIHHNYFLDFKSSGKNNASGLHIGSSYRSMASAHSVVEYNLFVRNRGENEGAICNKSSDNIYRFNTILDSTELSLRHGHRTEVYGNFIMGSDGIRFFGHDHHIFSNYFENCRLAIAIGNGGALIPPAKLQEHQRPDRVQVVYNTLVNNRVNIQMGGRNRGLGAMDLTVANNIIMGGGEAASITGPLPRAKWENNIIWENKGGAGDMPTTGCTTLDPQLEKDEHGTYRLQSGSPAIGKGTGDFDYVNMDFDGQKRGDKKDAGADQFSKAPNVAHALTEAEVGPKAPEDKRPLFGVPANVEWQKFDPKNPNRASE